MTAMEWTYALTGLAAGVAISFVALKGQQGAMLSGKDKQIGALNNDLSAKTNELIQAKEAAAKAEAALEITKSQHEDWKKSLETQWKQQLESFMLANMKTVKENATEEYQEKQKILEEKVTGLLKPLSDALVVYKKQVEDVDKQHHANKEVLGQQLKVLTQETSRLSSALTFNKGRGDWGELELRRLLEDSGMQEGISFHCQVVLENKKRPDFKIVMPGDRVLFIDSKALQFDPQWFEDEDTSADAVTARQRKFVDSLRKAVKGLAERDYQGELKESAGFVVLYVPREAMLSNALMLDPGLFEESYSKKVILAGPLNLIAILKAVEHSWTMAEQSKRALEVLEEAKSLYEKAVLFVNRFDNVGKALKGVVKAYNDTCSTFEGRGGLIGRLQKFEKLSSKHKDQLLEEIAHVEFDYQPSKTGELTGEVAPETVSALESALNSDSPVSR